MYKTISFFSLVILFSCQSTSFVYNRVDMEGTIKSGSSISFSKKDSIYRNDFVVFDYFDKRIGKITTHVLRVVAMPGETIGFMNGKAYVNKRLFQFPPTSRTSFVVKIKEGEAWDSLLNYSSRLYRANHERLFFLSETEQIKLTKSKFVDSIYLVKVDSSYHSPIIISNKSFEFFNGFYYGPLRIPMPGEILNSEMLSLIPMTNKFKVGDKLSERLFFVVGDNIHWCFDSRDIGLIPESLIRGVVKNDL